MHNDISSHPKQQKAKHNADGQIGYGHSELTGVVQNALPTAPPNMTNNRFFIVAANIQKLSELYHTFFPIS